MPQRKMMTDNSTRDETDMSEVSDDIPVQSVCSPSEMTTDTGMTSITGNTETGLTTPTEGTEYYTCQSIKDEGKSGSIIDV